MIFSMWVFAFAVILGWAVAILVKQRAALKEAMRVRDQWKEILEEARELKRCHDERKEEDKIRMRAVRRILCRLASHRARDAGKSVDDVLSESRDWSEMLIKNEMDRIREELGSENDR